MKTRSRTCSSVPPLGPDGIVRLLVRLGRVTSRVGSVDVALEVSDAMRPGVVSLPPGWGHGRAGTSLAVANAVPGVSMNDLTDDLRVDPLSGNAAFSGVQVEVTSR